MLSKNDLVYLATVMFLTTRGGTIRDVDIDQAQFVASKIFDKVFNEDQEIAEKVKSATEQQLNHF